MGLASPVAFVTFVTYDAAVIQLSLIAFVATFCNIFVLGFHWTNQPHPKFLLLTWRKVCIRLHVLSGSVEIIAFAVSWAIKHDSVNLPWVWVQAIASLVQVRTMMINMVYAKGAAPGLPPYRSLGKSSSAPSPPSTPPSYILFFCLNSGSDGGIAKLLSVIVQ